MTPHVKSCSNGDPNYKYAYIIHNHPSLDKETINLHYNIEKWSLPMISKKYDIDFKSIHFLIQCYGYDTRGISESLKTPQIRERISAANLKRFGAINPLSKNTHSYHKRNKTVLDRYGCDNVFQVIDRFVDNNAFGKKSKISNLNRSFYKLLDDLGIDYTTEYALHYTDVHGKHKWKFYDVKIDNILIEINGDYWHANPTKYNSNHVFTFPKYVTTASEIWDADKFKQDLAINNGYTFLCIWETEIKQNIDDVIKKIKDQINNAGN
jgi:hypothetical protein